MLPSRHTRGETCPFPGFWPAGLLRRGAQDQAPQQEPLRTQSPWSTHAAGSETPMGLRTPQGALCLGILGPSKRPLQIPGTLPSKMYPLVKARRRFQRLHPVSLEPGTPAFRSPFSKSQSSPVECRLETAPPGENHQSILLNLCARQASPPQAPDPQPL